MSAPTRKVIPSATTPAFEPVSLAVAKDHLRLAPSSVDHDNTVLRLIVEARESVEIDTNVILATGTYTMKLDDFPVGDFIELPVRPVTSITSIVYTALDGTSSTWSSAEYTLYNHDALPRINLKYGYSWPNNRGWQGDITITFVAGYSAQSTVPKSLVQQTLVEIARRFEMRGDEPEKGTQALAYDSLAKRYARQTYP